MKYNTNKMFCIFKTKGAELIVLLQHMPTVLVMVVVFCWSADISICQNFLFIQNYIKKTLQIFGAFVVEFFSPFCERRDKVFR